MKTLQAKNKCWYSMCGTDDPDITCVIWEYIYNRIDIPHINKWN
jgi:hypothetical protein